MAQSAPRQARNGLPRTLSHCCGQRAVVRKRSQARWKGDGVVGKVWTQSTNLGRCIIEKKKTLRLGRS